MGKYGRYSGYDYVCAFRGCLSDLQSNLSELHQLGWTDEKSRSIFIQLHYIIQMFNYLLQSIFL